MTNTIGEQLRQRAKEYTPEPKTRGLRDIVSEHYKDIKHARQQDLPWEEIAKVLGTEISTNTLKKYFYEESSARKRWKKARNQTVKSASTVPSETGEQSPKPRTIAEGAGRSDRAAAPLPLPKSLDPFLQIAKQKRDAEQAHS